MSGTDTNHYATRRLHAATTSRDLFVALEESIRQLGYDGGHAIVLQEPGRDELRLCASTNPIHRSGATVAGGETPSTAALRRGEAWYANGEGDRLRTDDVDMSVGAVLPLRSTSDECYGALVATERVLDEQRESLEMLAEHLSLALVRVQTHEEISRRHQNDLTKLSLMTRAGEVIRSLELEPILANLMELALSSVQGEVGCIVLCREGGARVEVEWGLSADILLNLRVPDGRTLTHAVIEDAKPRMAGHVPTDPGIEALGPAEAVGSIVAVPLATRDRVLGCLVVARGEGGGFEERDLGLLEVVTGLSSNAIENAQLHQTEIERERLQAELRLAGEVQMGLLPSEVPEIDGLQCAATVWPCDESGGDYYDFMRIDEHRLAFCVGDATGHGIGAAFITTTARACLRACMHDDDLDLGALLERVSGLLEDDISDGKFITLFLGVYDSRDRTISYVSAGHDAGLLYRAESDSFEELEATGPPLAIFAGLTFESGRTSPLNPGDLLVVKSDGVTEAENESREQFGDDRLLDTIRTKRKLGSPEMVEAVHEQVVRFRSDAAQLDDITVLCVRAT